MRLLLLLLLSMELGHDTVMLPVLRCTHNFEAVSRSNLFSATMRSMSAFDSLPVSLVVVMALVLPVLRLLADTF